MRVLEARRSVRAAPREIQRWRIKRVSLGIVTSGRRVDHRAQTVFFPVVELGESLSFNAAVRAPRGDALEFVGASAWPGDHEPIDAIPLPHAEGDRQLGLRQIARPG